MKAKELLTASFMAVFFSTQPFWNPPAQSQTLHDLDRELTEIITLISPRVVVVEARSRIMPVLPIPLRNRDVHDTVRAIIGSGLVIDSAGHILTVLSHVRGYDDFRVEQGGRWYSASLVGVDNRLGIGLLKSDLIIALPLSVVREEPAAGRLAVAYGRSVGRAGFPSLGIIAGRLDDGSLLMSGSVVPGLPGGGVFDLSGRLIGVINSGNVRWEKDQPALWSGIVILPAEQALAAARRIISFGTREGGYLGVRAADIELVSATGEILGEGVAVAEVEGASPASQSGLRPGDVITRIGTFPVTSSRELQWAVNRIGADSTVQIELLRGELRTELSVTLTANKSKTNTAAASEYALQTAPPPPPDFEIWRKIDSLTAEISHLRARISHLMRPADSSR